MDRIRRDFFSAIAVAFSSSSRSIAAGEGALEMAPVKPPYDPIVSVEGMYKGSVSSLHCSWCLAMTDYSMIAYTAWLLLQGPKAVR